MDKRIKVKYEIDINGDKRVFDNEKDAMKFINEYDNRLKGKCFLIKFKKNGYQLIKVLDEHVEDSFYSLIGETVCNIESVIINQGNTEFSLEKSEIYKDKLEYIVKNAKEIKVSDYNKIKDSIYKVIGTVYDTVIN